MVKLTLFTLILAALSLSEQSGAAVWNVKLRV
jgi:hypothetical protein